MKAYASRFEIFQDIHDFQNTKHLYHLKTFSMISNSF